MSGMCVPVSMHVCVCACLCAYVCAHVCAYVCVCERERERGLLSVAASRIPTESPKCWKILEITASRETSDSRSSLSTLSSYPSSLSLEEGLGPGEWPGMTI